MTIKLKARIIYLSLSKDYQTITEGTMLLLTTKTYIAVPGTK